MQGCEEEGIVQLQEGVADFKAAGTKNLLPYLLALLAEAYGNAGRAEAGLKVLAEALTQEEKTGEHFYEAELYRLKGELLLAQEVKSQIAKVKSQKSEPPGTPMEAEACFLKAVEIARKQQAKSLELRAVMSLVRLRQYQARHHGSRNTQHETRTRFDEAHNMLSDIYGWFTEGFDTRDLQEAKALLDALA